MQKSKQPQSQSPNNFEKLADNHSNEDVSKFLAQEDILDKITEEDYESLRLIEMRMNIF